MENYVEPETLYSDFTVIGLNPPCLAPFAEESKKPKEYIDSVDVFLGEDMEEDKERAGDVGHIKMSSLRPSFLRVKYTQEYDKPLTNLKLIQVTADPENTGLLVKKKYVLDYGYFPISFSSSKECVKVPFYLRK